MWLPVSYTHLENLQHDQFVEELGEYDHDRVKFLTCQEVDDEFTAARDILKELAAYALSLIHI